MKACSTQATRQWTRSAGRLTRQCSECHLPDFVSELSSFDFEPERFKCEGEDIIIISGSFGRKGMQAAALEDFEAPGKDILLIGSYCIRKKRKAARAVVLQGFDGE